MHGDSGRGLTMKKTALITLALSTLYLVLSTTVRAQTLTFDRSYQDYQYNLTLYNQAYSDYRNAKNAYLANQTLALKEDARQKTLTLLKARDQLMIVYLTALRTKIVENTGLTNDEKGGMFTKINGEVEWYTNDKSKYNDDDSLDTLFGRSEESRSRYKTNTSVVIAEALVNISLGQEVALRLGHEQVFSTLKSIIDAGVTSGKLTLNPFNHWLTDIDSTDQILKQNEVAVKTEIAKIYGQSSSPQNVYDSSVTLLASAITPLSRFNEFLTEVLNYIKNQK